MALVGTAHVVVRAITNRVDRDIRDGFRNIERTGRRAGENLGQAFSRGFNRNTNVNIFTRVADGIRSMVPAAEQARRAFSNLSRVGITLGPIISGLIGGITALINSLVALVGNAAGAAASLAVIGNAAFALIAGFTAVRLALGGVGQALSQLNSGAGGGGGAAQLQAIEDAERSLARVIEQNRESLINANNAVRRAQLNLNEALREGREEIQQLGFDAEDAALAEQRAAIELEDARRRLAGVQDLPPNSRARQEAELAYQEAELNLRRARDRTTDLNAEQDRLARTGVRGTSVVINATNALAEAEANRARTIRDALRAEADAQDALNRAQQGSGGGGGNNPFADLNQAQIDFVNFIQSLRPQFDELKEIAANSFLPPLREAIELLMDEAFPVVARGIGIVGAAMGQAAISLAQAITEGRNLDLLGRLFTASGPLLETFGRILGRLYGAILSILVASIPVAERFFGFLEDRLTTFDEFLKSVEGNQALNNFFSLASDAAAQWGEIIGNIFAAFGGIIEANLGPGSGGQYLLDWLSEVTGGWRSLNDTVGGRNELREFFLATAVNGQKILSAIGALLETFRDVSINPNLGLTFDNLAAGAPALSSMLNKLIDTGPALGTLVANLTRVFDILTDVDTGNVFFSTLNSIVEGLIDLLQTEFVQKILEFMAPITGFLLAIGLVGTTLLFAGKILAGFALLWTQNIGAVIGFIANLNPVIRILLLVAAAFTTLYATNDVFRESINSTFSTLGPLFAELGGTIATLVGTLAELFSGALVQLLPTIVQLFLGLAGAISTVLQIVIPFITQLVQRLAPVFAEIVEKVLGLAVSLLQQLVPAFITILNAVLPFVQILFDALIPAFLSLLDAILPVITNLIDTLLPVFTLLIEAIMPLVTTLLDALIPVFSMLVTTVAPLITILAESLAPVITEVLNAVVPLIAALVEEFVPVLQELFESFAPLLPQITDLITQGLEFLLPIIVGLVDVIAKTLIPIFVATVDTIGNLLLPIFTYLGDTLGGLIDFVVGVFTGDWQKAFDALVKITKAPVNLVIGLVEGMVNGIITLINGMIGSINDVGGSIADSLGLPFTRLGRLSQIRIPRLAEGGTVFPSRGGSIVNVAEAGKPERIEPLDDNGLSERDKAWAKEFVAQFGATGAQTVFNIYQQPGESADELAEKIARIIMFKNRRGGAVFP